MNILHSGKCVEAIMNPAEVGFRSIAFSMTKIPCDLEIMNTPKSLCSNRTRKNLVIFVFFVILSTLAALLYYSHFSVIPYYELSKEQLTTKIMSNRDPAARYELGKRYIGGYTEKGEGKIDRDAGLHLIRASAYDGYVPAILEIAEYYLSSEPLPIDSDEDSYQRRLRASFLLEEAALKGVGIAQAKIGKIYLEDFNESSGFSKDSDLSWQKYKKAIFFHEKAAHKGFCLSQKELGIAYLDGKILSQNYAEAYYWFLLASSCDLDSVKYRNKVEVKLSPEQLYNIQDRAGKFIPKEINAQ